MEMKWSLNELYTSFDSNEFKEDMISFENSIEYIKKWTIENCNHILIMPKLKIETYINFENNLMIL